MANCPKSSDRSRVACHKDNNALVTGGGLSKPYIAIMSRRPPNRAESVRLQKIFFDKMLSVKLSRSQPSMLGPISSIRVRALFVKMVCEVWIEPATSRNPDFLAFFLSLTNSIPPSVWVIWFNDTCIENGSFSRGVCVRQPFRQHALREARYRRRRFSASMLIAAESERFHPPVKGSTTLFGRKHRARPALHYDADICTTESAALRSVPST